MISASATRMAPSSGRLARKTASIETPPIFAATIVQTATAG